MLLSVSFFSDIDQLLFLINTHKNRLFNDTNIVAKKNYYFVRKLFIWR